MEMYKNKLAVAIKHNGKILRESKDLVHLPFGSEFSVLVKNLNSRRAEFTLHIDGQDVLEGRKIIVDANSEVEMKRFIRNGNMDEGNAFKFIERTQAIEDGPRGIKVDDGIVRVEFWFEKEKPEIKEVTTIYRDKYYYDGYYWRYPLLHPPYWNGPYYGTSSSMPDVKLGNATSDTDLRGQVMAKGIASGVLRGMSQNATYSANNVSAQSSNEPSFNSAVPMASNTINDVGITVPGSKVEQKFSIVYGFDAEEISNIIILRLVGIIGMVEVKQPITVKSKAKCITCGHQNKANSKFCSHCGTALELL